MMAREIKFRAWHTINQVMFSHKDIPVLLKNIENDNVWKFMQYTGLKDWNEKEIYEGDLFIEKSKLGKVVVMVIEFWDGSFHYSEIEDMGGSLFDSLKSRYIEVIGNIYENPELIHS